MCTRTACQDHTAGINCERCADGYFRLPGVGPDHPKPCVPCSCHRSGCPSGRCASASILGEERDLSVGQCECRPGYTGLKCDRCAPGFRGFPDCEPCPCDLAGTLLTEDADCEHECRCKEYVQGERCDRCKSGYFALDQAQPEGCLACFCSGVPDATCKEAKLSLQLGELGAASGWHVTEIERNQLIAASRASSSSSSSSSSSTSESSNSGALLIAADDLPFRAEDYFWIAPPLPYLADLLTSYGQQLRLQLAWVSARGDTSGRPTRCPDLVLEGDGMVVGVGDESYVGNNATIAVTLHEHGWRHLTGPDQGDPVSRSEFLRVLAGLKHVMIRAKFHTDQIEGRLNVASLERGMAEGEGEVARHIEECVCPPGYAGLSCERCQDGFRRVNNTLQGGRCVPCDCNGHAPTCDPFTGDCGSCQHNTEGETCEYCRPGFYGDARKGRPDSCKRCACPLEEPMSNNVSPSCQADPESGPGEHLCTACPPGYEGRHCERCSPGFWGNPLEPGSTCQPCECQGNLGLNGEGQGAAPSCDPMTGRCLRCRGNTAGWRCEACLPGHYGNPEAADCRPCKCDLHGADGSSCDSRTGQCSCRPHVTGRACDRCEEGRGGVANGCPLCQCGTGSQSPLCDPRSGQCPCKPGVGGNRCDICLSNHFGLGSAGCQRCNCDTAGSEGSTCDIVTGQCRCKPHVEGRTCNKCRFGYWDLNSRRGCLPCACDPVGCSTAGQCDQKTGQCECRAGVSGRACDRCKSGFYGFSTSGCKECEPCYKPGHLCDPDTGRCVCPPLTEGVSCERCRNGAWGYEREQGCKMCGCHSAGSLGAQCDLRTGACPCRPGFGGQRCDKCLPGHYGFPRCSACECHVPGTMSSSCPFGQPCGCDDAGQCLCKSNVVGKRCEHCRRGTFSLQGDNPEGCTPCFCFERTNQCTQAQFVWGQIRMLEPRSVSIEYDSDVPQFRPGSPISPVNTQEICYINLAVPGEGEMSLGTNKEGTSVKLNVTNNLRIIPGDLGNVRIGVSYLFDTPLYWKLPSNFLGDKVLSYNGYLRFTTKAIGGHTLLPPGVIETYPLVQLQGHNNIVLEYLAPQTNPTGQYEVRLHEAWWRAKKGSSVSGAPVTRKVLMLALQNLQHVLIRATDSVDFQTLELRNVSLDVAIAPRGYYDGLPVSVPAWQVARGVEQCECPSQYGSTSCQNPGIGFYRWLPPPHHVESTIIIQLIGEARPCPCASRSQTCDVETGTCLNCTDHTAGSSCDRCGPGYYGDPSKAPCQPCPCPNKQTNFALSCNVGQREVTCRCQPGYTGPRCERCAYGYFGYPLSPGGSCQPCECVPRGSVSDECHEETGQCNCRPGVEGRDCSLCPSLHVLGDRGCHSCNDGCSGALLRELHELTVRLAELNVTNLSPAPWGRLNALEDEVQGPLRKGLQLYFSLMATPLPTDAEEELRRRVRQLVAKGKLLKEEGSKTATNAGNTLAESEDLLKDIEDLNRGTEDTVAELRYYGQQTESMAPSVNAALREAGLLLDKITSAHMSKPRKEAEQALKKAREQLESLQELLGEIDEETPFSIKSEHVHLKEILFKLSDMEKRTSAINEVLDQASRQSKYNSAAFATTSELLPRIEDEATMEKEASETRERLTGEAQELLDEARENFQELSQLVQDVDNASRQLEHREGLLARLNPLYQRQYVIPASEHAAELLRQARLYNDRFNATREVASFALRAAQAYQEIVTAIDGAFSSATQASESATKAFETVNANDLSSRVKSMRQLSDNLVDTARSAGGRVTRLQRRLVEHRDLVKAVEERVNVGNKMHETVSSNIDQLKAPEHHASLAETLEIAAESSRIAQEAAKTADEISERIKTELRPALNRLPSQNSPALAMVATQIEKARQNTIEADSMLTSLHKEATAQAARLAQWNDTLSEKLQQLRDTIAQARHAANGIRLSLGSGAGKGCVRSYKARLEPSITTSIVLTFAPNGQGDGVLLVLRADPTHSRDFLALEVRDRRIRLSWDLGGGPGEVTHPLVVKPASNLANDSSWFRVQVERTGNVAQLNVRGVIWPESLWPENARNSSPAGHGRLDLGAGSTLWLGGFGGPASARPPGIVAPNMPGCIHQVWLDGRPLGLWDFIKSSGNCEACLEGAEELRGEQNFFLQGEGYSVLHFDSSAPYNPYQFSVSMDFRTFDEDALLFIAINPKRDRFISLSLRGGRVHFRVDYGGDARLELTTSGRYNTGQVIRVEAARYFDRNKRLEKGLLRVGDEEPSGAPSPPPGAGSLPDLAQGTYLVGGAPPGFLAPTAMPPPELRSFRGCISDLQVVNEGYNLLRGTYYAVESGCPADVVKDVSFVGDGYLELQGRPLGRKSSLSLVFATKQTEALLLLSEPVYQDANPLPNFYSVALLRGQLHVRVGAGKGNVTVRSGNTFNDGRPHAVTLIKTNRRLELLVDDKSISASKLAEGSSPEIKVSPRGRGGLFIGGLPHDMMQNASGLAASLVPLQGLIKDLIISDDLISMDKPISFLHAGIGRSRLPAPSPIPLPLVSPTNGVRSLPDRTSVPPGPTHCEPSRAYSLEPGAVKFGDKPHSHVTMQKLWPQQKNGLPRDFTLKFDFRTHYPNGLLFLLPSLRPRQNNRMLVRLVTGQVEVTLANPRKEIKLRAKTILNDGSWHSVEIIRQGQAVRLLIDGVELDRKKAPKKINVLSTAYVGGLPETNSISVSPAVAALNIEDFKGCLRAVKVQGRDQDLVGQRGYSHNVGQCFPKVESGSFFPGDAFAIYQQQFQVGTMLELALEFRTAELSGVLLSVSEPAGHPALSLELLDGQVILSGDMGNRKPFRVQQSFASKYTACDNKWHHVQAIYIKDSLLLRVDQQTANYGHSINGGLRDASTNSSLYIGGLPDAAPSGTLQTRDNFKGCIRNVAINSERRDWTDMALLHNVLLSACPLSAN